MSNHDSIAEMLELNPLIDSDMNTRNHVAAVLEFLACTRPLEGIVLDDSAEFGRDLILTLCAKALRYEHTKPNHAQSLGENHDC